MPSAYVLDTNVISSFEKVGWLEAVAIWTPETDIVATEAVWDEVLEDSDVPRPEWLEVESAELEHIETESPGALAPADWTCLARTVARDGATVVTNDTAIHAVAERRGIPYEWGTRFLLRTFDRCGLDRPELDAGLDEYSRDLGLPDDVEAELRDAEKDE